VGAFADITDLAIFMGLAGASGIGFPTDEQEAQADLILDLVSDAIRSYCHQDFDLVTNDTVKLEGNWTAALELPQRPVTGVSEVKVDGIVLPSMYWYWDGRDSIRRGPPPPSPTVVINAESWPWPWTQGHWGGPVTTVEPIYSHGYAEIPGDVVLVCLTAAREALTVGAGVSGETIGTYSVTYEGSQAAGVFLNADARSVLAKYRRTWK
jgi:hypothetical protein